MPKLSRWKAQHVGCQAAVDNLKADMAADIERLEAEKAQLRGALAQIVGAFTSGIYCSNCGESLDDGCACVLDVGRKALESR